MIIEEISVRNWRGFRDTHTFHFDDRFNLLVGRNEAGKSTIFEALTCAMLDGHKSGSKEIKQMQPIGSSLGPEATILFQSDGVRYKVFKRFLQSPKAEIHAFRGNKWELDHEGDEADKQLRELLNGDPSSRKSNPDYRGLSQALWYLQKDDPLPKKAWAEGVTTGLSGFISLVTKSPEEDKIIKKIEEAYSSYFTPKGRVVSGSEVQLISNQLEEMEGKLQEFNSNAKNVEGFRLDLEDFYGQKSQKSVALEEAEKELNDLKIAVADAAGLEKEKRIAELAIKEKEKELEKITNDQSAISRRLKSIIKTEKELEEKSSNYEILGANARVEKRGIDHYHSLWKEKYEPELKEVEKNLLRFQSIERIRQLKKGSKIIEKQILSIQELNETVSKLEVELKGNKYPLKMDLEEYQKKSKKLSIVQAKAELAAIRVGFDLEIKDELITTNPQEHSRSEDGEYIILGPTEFTLGPIGKIWVRGGDSSLEELKEEANGLSSYISSTLEYFDVKNDEEFLVLFQKRKDLEKDIKRHKKELGELTSENDVNQLEAESERITKKINDIIKGIGSIPQEFAELPDEDVAVQILEFDGRKKELISQIADAQKNEDSSRQAYLQALNDSTDANNFVIALRSQIKSLGNENSEVLKHYGSYDHLNKLIEKTNTELKAANSENEELLEEYAIKVEKPKIQLEIAEKVILNLRDQLQKINVSIADKKARIESIFAQNLYTEAADLEALIEAKKRRLERVERDAAAIKLLYDMVHSFKQEQSSKLTGPVAELINRWLILLTDESYESILLSDDLYPEGVINPNYNEILPVESLSYGTHEQIIVLLRLAIGVILSSDERNLVVIDDRLVNADSVRMRRLCQILEEVAVSNCQIIVATCNDTPYAGINGNIVRVPGEKILEES